MPQPLTNTNHIVIILFSKYCHCQSFIVC